MPLFDVDTRGPQQAEILDTDAEILAEILLEIRDPNPKQYFPVISVKYVNLYHVNYNVRHPASWHNSLCIVLLILGRQHS